MVSSYRPIFASKIPGVKPKPWQPPEGQALDWVKFAKWLWPDYNLYNVQQQILYSVRDNIKTVVPASNEMGKDFIAAMAALIFFLTRPVATVVTTSVKAEHLDRVMWGELRRFIATCAFRLPIQYNHRLIRKLMPNGSFESRSGIHGQVVEQGEALQGYHLERLADGGPTTLLIVDEASAFAQTMIEMADSWAHRMLIIGNTYQCENEFKWSVEGRPGTDDRGGDLPHPSGQPGLYRKVIHVRAEDSPNVRLAQAEIRSGMEPSRRVLVPGVVSWDDYVIRRKYWDPIKQCIGLDAQFYKGASVLMFPPQWLDAAHYTAATQQRGYRGKRVYLGVDSAEGGDNTCFCVGDSEGLLELRSVKTKDTTEVVEVTIQLMNKYKIKPEDVLFDRGGGGKQHADRLRKRGKQVRTVAFGEPPSDIDLFRKWRTAEEVVDQSEQRTVYKNRRAEMYGIARSVLDPDEQSSSGYKFGIPAGGPGRPEYGELRRQLAPIPLLYDREGVMFLPPKHKKDPKSKEKTLTEIIGHSPDEADAFVMMVFAMIRRTTDNVVTTLF